jgi:hypothetical protein
MVCIYLLLSTLCALKIAKKVQCGCHVLYTRDVIDMQTKKDVIKGNDTDSANVSSYNSPGTFKDGDIVDDAVTVTVACNAKLQLHVQ